MTLGVRVEEGVREMSAGGEESSSSSAVVGSAHWRSRRSQRPFVRRHGELLMTDARDDGPAGPLAVDIEAVFARADGTEEVAPASAHAEGEGERVEVPRQVRGERRGQGGDSSSGGHVF